MRTINNLLLTFGLAAAGIAAAQAPRPAPKPMPPTATVGRSTPSPAIIVQGGITPQPGCGPSTGGSMSGTPSAAIGPKQDDPVGPHPNSAATSGALASSTGAIAIGPKQDDPVGPHPSAAIKCTPAAH